MKTKLVSLIVVAVFLVNIGLVAEAKPEPIIDRIVFIHRLNGPDGVIDAAKPAGGGSGGSTKTLYKWSGLHWDDPHVTYTASYSVSGLDQNSVQSAITASFQTWTNADPKITFTYDNTLPFKSAGTSDGVNEISFGPYSSSNTIAVTFIWYNRFTKAVTEVDTLFNTYYQWSTSDVCSNGKMDVQNIATHEFGHWLVLDDLYTKPAIYQTMYGYSRYGETQKRTLNTGDIAGIELIYPP